MKRLILLLIAFISHPQVFSQTWLWANTTTNTTRDEAFSVSTDAAGNAFACGWTGSPVMRFSPTHTLSGTGGSFYLAKYDPNGNVLWVRGPSSGGSDAKFVHTDGSGNVIICGMFSYTMVIGSTTLTTGSMFWDSFVAKYDTNGNLLWVRSGGGAANDAATGVTTDPSGNVIICGYYHGPQASWGSHTLTASGSSIQDFVVKYDPSGNILWAMQSSASIGSFNHAISCDNSGNIIFTGRMGPTITFSTFTLTQTNNSGPKFYLVKLDPAANVLWASCATGTGQVWAHSLSTDPSGDFYIAGYYGGTNLTFAGQTFTSVNSNAEGYIAKYGSNGAPQWVRTVSGNKSEVAFSVSAHALGAFISGMAQSNSLIIGTSTLSSLNFTNSGNGFFASFDQTGNVNYAMCLNGGGDDFTAVAAVDPCTAYFAGTFDRQNLVIGNHTLANINFSNSEPMYIAKFTRAVNISVSSSGVPAICAGQTATLVATGATSYTWNTGASAPVLTVAPLNTTTYTLSGAGVCTGGTAAVTVTVHPLPTLSLSPVIPSVCAGNTLMLNASGASTLNWSNGIVNGIPFVPAGSSIYTVSGTDHNQCKSELTVSVLVVPNPVTTIQSSGAPLCPGESVTLTATGAGTMSWQPGGAITPSIIVNPTQPSTFSVTQTLSGCSDTKSILVNVLKAPQLTLTASSTSVCANSAVALYIYGADGYYWSNQSTDSILYLQPLSTITYSVWGTKAAMTCTSLAMITITVTSCLSVDEASTGRSDLIYPNPNRDEFSVNLQENARLTIVDGLGKIVLSVELEKGIHKISSSDLSPGIYHCVLESKDISPTVGRLIIK